MAIMIKWQKALSKGVSFQELIDFACEKRGVNWLCRFLRSFPNLKQASGTKKATFVNSVDLFNEVE